MRPKPFIESIPPSVHGGFDYAGLRSRGISPDGIIDFSVSVNPFGPPPGIESVLARAVLDRYPDSESTGVRELVAGRLGCRPQEIIIGNGSTELIRLVTAAYIGQGDRVMIPQPTYGEYEIASAVVGADVIKVTAADRPDLRFNLPRMLRQIRESSPDALFLCNPNNPTGEYLSRAAVEELIGATGDAIVIIDEAYLAFTDNPWDSMGLVETGRVVVVRSMTKDFAIPGLRIGYAVASAEIIGVLNRIKPPWNVSSVAQAAAEFALGASGYLEKNAEMIRESKSYLISGLLSLGLAPLPSHANFFLVKVRDAEGLCAALFDKGILVRNCASFGLNQFVRIAPRSLADCERLLTAIDSGEVRPYAS